MACEVVDIDDLRNNQVDLGHAVEASYIFVDREPFLLEAVLALVLSYNLALSQEVQNVDLDLKKLKERNITIWYFIHFK